MFEIGQLIYYGSTGVCRVEEIKSMSFTAKGEERLYYVLKPLHQTCTISTPVTGGKVFMRPILSRTEAEQLIDSIPQIDAAACSDMDLRQLANHYEEMLKSHDCTALMKLSMSIYLKKQARARENKKFGAVDERFMKQAETLLFGELSAALDIPMESVTDYIAARLGDNTAAGEA